MVEDIEDVETDVLGIKVDPNMSTPNRNASYRIQVEKILHDIEVKRYGPDGEPKYHSHEEFQFCMEGRYINNVKKLETEVEYLERRLRDKDSQINIARIERDEAQKEVQKKQEECGQLKRSNEHKERALHSLTDEMERNKFE